MDEVTNNTSPGPELPYVEVCRPPWWSLVFLGGPGVVVLASAVLAMSGVTTGGESPASDAGGGCFVGVCLCAIAAWTSLGVSTVITDGRVLLRRPLVPYELAVADISWATAIRYRGYRWLGEQLLHGRRMGWPFRVEPLHHEQLPPVECWARFHTPYWGPGRGVFLVVRGDRQCIIASRDPDRMLAALRAAGYTGAVQQ